MRHLFGGFKNNHYLCKQKEITNTQVPEGHRPNESE